MSNSYCRLWIIIFVIILIVPMYSYTIDILVWDHDPDREDRFDDPYTFVLIHDEDKIVASLKNEGFNPVIVETLPDDLSLYDLIFVCIGWTTC